MENTTLIPNTSNSEIIIYQPDADVKLEVRLNGETVWLNRQQMAVLFDRDVKTIGKHVNNALTEELKGIATVANFATVQQEGTQNSIRQRWTAEEVDEHLHRIMADIHEACIKYGTEEDGYINYVKGANIAGFIKVANAMVEQGVV